MDYVEDVVGPNSVLHSVHEEDDSTFEEEVEDDGVVDHGDFGESQQVSPQPEFIDMMSPHLPPTFALDPFLRQNPLTKTLTLGILMQRNEQSSLVYDVSLLDKPAAGPGDHDGSLLDVDVGRLLGCVRVPVQAKAQAHPTPHCVGWVVLDIALIN